MIVNRKYAQQDSGPGHGSGDDSKILRTEHDP